MNKKLYFLFLVMTTVFFFTSLGKGSEPEAIKVDEPDYKLCSICHEDVIKAWEAKKYQHAPAAAGDCTVCHSSHASDEKYFLLKKTNELCIGCHGEQSSGKHVIASFIFGSSHPVDGKINPLKPENSFSCVSCHSPHASNAEKLFAFDTQGGSINICQACHKK
jgi:predicted CXXCH cytochrome family protein